MSTLIGPACVRSDDMHVSLAGFANVVISGRPQRPH
jgi:hypothetical protein